MNTLHEVIFGCAIAYFVWKLFALEQDVKKLKAQLYLTALQSNKNEMNIDQLYYIRDVNDLKAAVSFDGEALQALKQDLNAKHDDLVAQNKRLTSEGKEFYFR